MTRTQPDGEALMAYWHTPTGRTTWQHEFLTLTRSIMGYKGGRLLEMSGGASLVAPFSPHQHVRWAPTAHAQHLWHADYIADGCAQPFDDCCFDTVIIHHWLDCVSAPHHWLSEAARITADTGRLYLIGWNPLQPRWPDIHDRHPARRRLFIRQLRDWLAFVDFEIEQVHYCSFSTARCRTAVWAERFGTMFNVPLGGSYIVSARRQKQYIVPLVKRFRHRRLLNLGGIPKGMLAPMPSTTLPEHHHTDNESSVTHPALSHPSGHHEQH